MRKRKIVGKSLQQLLKKLQVNTTKLILVNMKKILFSALACVAFAASSFASNEVVYEKQDLSLEMSDKLTIQESQRPCTVYVWVTAPDG